MLTLIATLLFAQNLPNQGPFDCRARVDSALKEFSPNQDIPLVGEYFYKDKDKSSEDAKLPVRVTWKLYLGASFPEYEDEHALRTRVRVTRVGHYNFWFVAANDKHIAICTVEFDVKRAPPA